jgi:hypothetical protein
MPIPTDQQREYYVASLPLDTLAVPLTEWNNKIAILPNGDQYWSDGITWQPYGTTSSAVGALDANSPIANNPTNLDTPAEMAAAIQAQAAQIATLQNFRANFDSDNDGRVDANRQQSNEYDFPVPSLVWNIPHGFGRKPEITCYDLTGTELDNPPRQDPSNNTSIITWLTPQPGKAVCS